MSTNLKAWDTILVSVTCWTRCTVLLGSGSVQRVMSVKLVHRQKRAGNSKMRVALLVLMSYVRRMKGWKLFVSLLCQGEGSSLSSTLVSVCHNVTHKGSPSVRFLASKWLLPGVWPTPGSTAQLLRRKTVWSLTHILSVFGLLSCIRWCCAALLRRFYRSEPGTVSFPTHNMKCAGLHSHPPAAMTCLVRTAAVLGACPSMPPPPSCVQSFFQKATPKAVTPSPASAFKLNTTPRALAMPSPHGTSSEQPIDVDVKQEIPR